MTARIRLSTPTLLAGVLVLWSREGSLDVFVITVDGSGQTRLTGPGRP